MSGHRHGRKRAPLLPADSWEKEIIRMLRPPPHRKGTSCTEAVMVWHYGPEGAALRLSGRHGPTEDDIAAWHRLCDLCKPVEQPEPLK